jgi:lambda repressor-like predicted transcriptional regulator
MTTSQNKKQRCTKAQCPERRPSEGTLHIAETFGLLPHSPHREEIKAAIRMHGVTLVSLGRRWGYSESALRQALRRPYPRIERLIANFLRTKPERIWPDRYDAFGKPNRGRSVRP